MVFHLTPVVWTAFGWALFLLASVTYWWRVRHAYGSRWLLLLTLLATSWAVCYGLEIAATNLPDKLFWLKGQWLSLTLLPLCWLAMVARGAGYEDLIFGRGRWFWWLLLPLIFVILAWSNERHHLVWLEVTLPTLDLAQPLRLGRNAFFWLNAFYAVGICVLVMLITATSAMQLPLFRRRYVIAVSVGLALPLLGNLLYLAGLELTLAASYWLSGWLLCWGLYQIRSLNLVPIARGAIIEQLPDGVLVLDEKNRLLDCNPAARRILGLTTPSVTGRLAVEVLKDWPELVARYGDTQSVQEEITLNGRVCELRIAPLTTRLGQATGRLIVLRDITDRVRSTEELDQRTIELQTVLQAFPDLMFRFDEQDRFSGYTASTEAQFYARPEQFLGKRADEVLPDPIGAQLLAALQRVRHEGVSQALDYSLSSAGVTRWFEARLFPARREVVAVVRDVTERQQAELELRQQKDLFEKLVKVARATSEQPTLEATLQNVFSSGVDLTEADQGSLFLLNEAGLVTQALAVHEDSPPLERQAFIDRLLQEGLPGWVWRTRQAALILDTDQDTRWLSAPTSKPIRAALAVPILSDQRLLGVLVLTHSRPGHFTTDHLNLMEAAADQMALAVRNAHLYEWQRRLTAQQTALYEVLRAISGQLDVNLIAQTAVEAITHFANWPHVALLLAEPETRSWVVRAVSGQPSLALGYSLPIAPDVSYARHLAAAPGNEGVVPVALPLGAAGLPDAASLAVPLWSGGTLIGILFIEGDNTTRLESEDLPFAQSLADTVALALDNARLYEYINDERSRLRASIYSSRDGIVLLGMDQRILVINMPALHLLTLPAEPDRWLNRSLGSVIPLLRVRSRPAVRAMLSEMRRLQRGDEAPAEGEYEIAGCMIHWTDLPVLSSGQPIGRLIVLRDVTAEYTLSLMREDLTNTLVHDLRNPTSVVLGALELLDDETLQPLQSEIVHVARQGAQKLLDLVNAILDVNRLESGQMQLEREPVPLPVIATEIIALEQVLANDKQQTLRQHVPIDLPLVLVDVELIRRVLQNLIGNAIKFTPPSGRIIVTAWPDPDNRTQLIVSVKDNGPGLSPDMQSRLFQKFITGRIRGRGTGLGLAFCRLAIEAHGGRIWVDSSPGHGADFRFTLPVAEEE